MLFDPEPTQVEYNILIITTTVFKNKNPDTGPNHLVCIFCVLKLLPGFLNTWQVFITI